jgi:hypothetical protein
MEIKRSGSRPSGKGPAEYFTGAVRIDPIVEAPEPARVRAATQEPKLAAMIGKRDALALGRGFEQGKPPPTFQPGSILGGTGTGVTGWAS